MNAFPVGLPLFATAFTVLVTYYRLQSGTRVFYWGANGEINYGTVQSTSRMADVSVCSELSIFHLLTVIAQGTQILVIREDSGKNTTLP
jgi:ABC-type taurine transport system substrate-binding protein